MDVTKDDSVRAAFTLVKQELNKRNMHLWGLINNAYATLHS